MVKDKVGVKAGGKEAFLLLMLSFVSFTEYNHPSTVAQIFQSTLFFRKDVTPSFAENTF